MIFKTLLALVIGIPALIGSLLLFTPADKLISSAKRASLGLPMPTQGTTAFKILVGFYRFLGVIALGFSVFVIFIFFTQGH